MNLYCPNLSDLGDDTIEASHVAIEQGRRLALADLEAHPDKPAEAYALAAASYLHATLYPGKRNRLLATLASNSLVPGSTNSSPAQFAEHKDHLEELRRSFGHSWSAWACYLQDIAFGIAQVADELFQADADGREYRGTPTREFVLQFIANMPEYKYVSTITPVARRVERAEPAAPTIVVSEVTVTTEQLIERWLDAKGGLSRAERSRQGSSARLFLDAMGLADAKADQLAKIGTDAADRFVRYAARFPLAPRGNRARIAHVKSFIAYAQSVHIAVPSQDWRHVHA